MPNDNRDSGIDNELLFRAAWDYLNERIEWLTRERALVESQRSENNRLADSALAYIDERLADLLDHRRGLAQLQIEEQQARQARDAAAR